jgi:hypothetical protein
MLYNMWYDDNPKKPVETKIAEAIAAYVARFGSSPNVVLCNEAQRCAVVGVQVRGETRIGKDLFHVGWEAGATC